MALIHRRLADVSPSYLWRFISNQFGNESPLCFSFCGIVEHPPKVFEIFVRRPHHEETTDENDARECLAHCGQQR